MIPQPGQKDEPLIAKFHEGLSERTVFMRYLQAMNLSQRTGHERLSRLSFIDYDRELALVALRRDGWETTPPARYLIPATPFLAVALAAVWDRIVVGDELRSRLAEAGAAPVLLVDDLADSRWTMTVAGRELRRAGAVAVLPFAIALTA